MNEEPSPPMKPGVLKEQDRQKDKASKVWMTAFDMAFATGGYGVMCIDCKGFQMSAIHIRTSTCRDFPDMSSIILLSPSVARWR